MENKTVKKSIKDHINHLMKEDHIYTAEKFAEQIYDHSPVKQQEMLEAIKIRIVQLNKEHLKRIQG